jgi:hypothetical protein
MVKSAFAHPGSSAKLGYPGGVIAFLGEQAISGV